MQSDGQSPDNRDDQIDLHVPAGTDYLEVENLGGTDFTGQPGQLDMVTVNTGSNDLTQYLDINGGGDVAQASRPAARCPSRPSRNFGGEATDLLVANNADGHLALFGGEPAG